LRKIIKSSNTEEINTFRLHYFPNIPAAGGGHGNGSGPGGVVAAGPAAAAPKATTEQVDREAIERNAYEAGFARGEAEARQAVQQQSAPLLAALETTLSELDGARSRIRQYLEQEVVELALQVARRVIRHELSVSKDTILCVVQEAMNSLEDPGKIAIRLNPADLEHIRQAGERLASVLDNLDSIQFEEDPGIECGGCYIQTDYGEVDARIQEQLRVVEEALRAELRASAADP
jgi:flagellar assembly protein FliH